MSERDPKQTRLPRSAEREALLSPSLWQRVDEVCDRFEDAWKRGQRPQLENYLAADSQPECSAVLRELLAVDLAYRRRNHEPANLDEYQRRFPEHAELVYDVFREVATSLGPPTPEALLAEWQKGRERGGDEPAAQLCDRHGCPELREGLEQRIEALKARSGPLDAARFPYPGRSVDEQPAAAGPVFKGYEVVRELGRGGMGVVYQAYDRKRGEQVALKTLQRLDAATLYRFKQEFRALADLAHPNLVTLHELVSDGRTWFFTMDLVDGTDFLRYVYSGSERRATGLSPSQLERLRGALSQLAEAVAALHASGKLHRDLKPTNVLVRSDHRLILVDFGLSTDLDQTGLYFSSEEHIVGTVAYMAPEQAEGRPVSPASDWYSVGVMLYQALTGELPFRGGEMQVLRDKQWLDPPAPRELVPDVPEDLNALCVGLLSRRPEERPAGAEVLRRLKVSPPVLGVSAARPTGAAPFIGRARHLEALADAFRTTLSGRVVVVYVRGRSGQGKTALVQHFLDGLQERAEAVFLAGRCYEQELVPYKAIDSLIDALSCYLRQLARHEVEALLPRDAAALTRLFPVLRRVAALAEAPRHASEVPDQQELRRRGFAALRKLLGRLGDRRPLVLWIDDLQWGDVDSAALLSELVRPPEAPALLLLACMRTEDEATSPCLLALREAWEKEATVLDLRRITVEALAPPEARALAQALLDSGATATPAQVDAVALESGGDPFFVHELVQHFRTHEPLSRASLAATELSLNQVLGARLQQLPRESRRLLEVVALACGRLDWAAACLAAEVGTEAHAALGLLRVGRLVRAAHLEGQKEAVETFHDRIREAVLGHLTPAAVKGYHGRLAAALEATGQADPETLAVHFHGAEDLPQAAHYYMTAAEKAAAALAFDRAAKLYRLALELRPVVGAAECELRGKLGDALANAGRGLEAARQYEAAAVGASAAHALELQRRAAYHYCISGHLDDGRAILRMVLGRVGMKLPRTPKGALLSLLGGQLRLWLRGIRYRARDARQIPEAVLNRIDVTWSASAGLSMFDVVAGADFQTRNLLLALRAGEPYRVARALAWQAAHTANLGGSRWRRTAQLLQAAQVLAEQINHPHARGITTLSAGCAEWTMGRWQNARTLLERAEGVLRDSCTGVAWELGTAHTFTLWALFYLGELAEMGRRSSRLLKEAQDRGDLYAATTLGTFTEPIARLAAADPEGARQVVDEYLGQWSHKGFHVQHVIALLSHTYIDLYCGNGVAAWKRMNDQWPSLARSRLLVVQAIRVLLMNARARSALAAAAAEVDPEPLLRAAARDARRMEREKMPYGNALTQLLRAGVAARRGDQTSAVRLFADAATRLDSADMSLFAAAAQARQGELLGGVDGRALVDAANARMKDQHVGEPTRMTAALAPAALSPAIGHALLP